MCCYPKSIAIVERNWWRIFQGYGQLISNTIKWTKINFYKKYKHALVILHSGNFEQPEKLRSFHLLCFWTGHKKDGKKFNLKLIKQISLKDFSTIVKRSSEGTTETFFVYMSLVGIHHSPLSYYQSYQTSKM